jgi:hypothetical protein
VEVALRLGSKCAGATAPPRCRQRVFRDVLGRA